MNKEAEIIAQLSYWNLITDLKMAKNVLKRARLMDEKDFGRAFLRKKEIELEETRANELLKEIKERAAL